MFEAMHIIVTPPDRAHNWERAYYPPLCHEAYQEGIVNARLNPAPNWTILHTRQIEIDRPRSPLNQTLAEYKPLEGDGLAAYQRAALEYALPDRSLSNLKVLWESCVASTLDGYTIASKRSNFTFWTEWSRLELIGLIEDLGETPFSSDYEKRLNVRFTPKGFTYAHLAARLYGWEMLP